MLTAIEESLPELEQWMSWAQRVPKEHELHQILGQGDINFVADRSWDYTIFEAASGEVLGAVGLHRTEAPERFEIGYWVRSSWTGRGIATVVVQAIIDAAATHLEAARQIVIRADQANVASASVARKLGFELQGEEAREIVAKGHTGRGFVWILELPADPGR